jgi:phosphoglycerol transferase MdoB-like AlkP superfamily enzyme
MLLADLWYYRASGYFLEFKYIVYKDLFNPLGRSVLNPSLIDLILILDIPVIIFLIYKKEKGLSIKRNMKTSLIGIITCLTIIFGWHYLFDIKRVADGTVRFMQEDWEAAWNPSTRAMNRSPLGDHLYEAYITLMKPVVNGDKEMRAEAEEWLDWNNEKLPDNKFKGLAQGKNVVLLQIESLENFVINQKVYDQEITPNLNKIINEGLYFGNIYEQNNAGNSIDCDVMANASVLTLGDSITFLTHPEVKYNSLARILGKSGYTTVSSHAERAGDWGWLEAHKAALGFQTSWDINEYNVDEKVGFGLSDRSLYKQFSDKLSKLQQPFFATVPTLSSHGPFDIKKQYRKLSLPEELDRNKLGGYFQSVHYADEQIGAFIDMLEEKGLMDNTILVIYGDHSGIHKYYMDDVEATQMEGDWWQEYRKQIPLIICGKGLPSETINTTGGHIDIMPTVAYLLGVDTDKTIMGRNLLNTNRNASVIKGGIVVGNPTTDEKVKFGQAYDVADYLIKNNYFEKTKKVD